MESRNSSLNMVQASRATRADVDIIGSAASHTAMLDLIKVNLSIHGRAMNVLMLPDTGANISAISKSEMTRLGAKGLLKPSEKKPISADGSSLRVLGRIQDVTITLGSCKTSVELMVIEGLKQPILSQQALKDLKLIHVEFPFYQVANIEDQQRIDLGHGEELNNIAREFMSIFEGKITKMRGGPFHIELEPGAKPINSGCSRKVPEPYMEALRREIETQIEAGVIEPIHEATEWLHPIVVVPKKGTNDVRLCVDLRRLNKHVKRTENPQQTPWEVVRTIPEGTNHFAVFDALKGYHQIELDKESRALTAFMTPLGRYRYVRLPMGLSAAGDAFTLRYGNAVDPVVDGRRATEDTLLYASTKAELIEKTRKLFAACAEAGIALNAKKIQWDQPEVLFGGFVLSRTGYRIDPTLTKALREFPRPQSRTDVRSFIGLVNQIGNFTDKVSEQLMPLKELLQHKAVFQWLPEHEATFVQARKTLSADASLAYYDARKETRLITDASRLKGLGFFLKQKQEDNSWRTVQAGSRFLSAAESRYAMIELEMLGIAWAALKCRNFIDGLPQERFEIWTDHQPLVPILESYTLPEIQNRRLQRLRMKVDHLQFRVKWIKSADNDADVLSRFPVNKPTREDQLDESDLNFKDDTAICALYNHVYGDDHKADGQLSSDIRDKLLIELTSAANSDNSYVELREALKKGDLSEEKFAAYRRFENDLHLDDDDLICYRARLLIPKQLRRQYLERLMGMHQGYGKLMARARKSIWWPELPAELKVAANSCESCEERGPSKPAEPVIHHETATYAFEMLHTDMCQYMGRDFLIVVDQFSGYPFIFQLGKGGTTTSRQVHDCFQTVFSQFGIPVIIYSDGGPQFRTTFSKFCEEWFVEHVQSSPYYPKSNGTAEVNVKAMKKLIAANFSPISKSLKPDMAKSLTLFRNAPRSPTELSPNQILFGTNLRDTLPASRSNFRPSQRIIVEQRLAEIRLERLHQKEIKQVKNTMFKLGQIVRLQDPRSKRWDKQVTIIGPGRNVRELQLRDSETGREFFRNRIFLKPVYNIIQGKDTDIRTVEGKSCQDLKGILVTSGRPKRNTQLPVRFRD